MTELGNKHECLGCGTKFYDLGKSELICPSCGENQKDLAAAEGAAGKDGLRGKKKAAKKKKAKPRKKKKAKAADSEAATEDSKEEGSKDAKKKK